MSEEQVSPQNISDLINYLMKSKDPATVGLRRILKKKAEDGEDFPLREHLLEELSDKESTGKVFSETEKRILELEKETLELKNKLATYKKNTVQTVQDAYKKGVQEGREEGEKTGHEKAKDEYVQQIKNIEERLVNVFKNIEDSRRSLITEAHRGVLDLCVLMARKIINTELTLNPDIVLSVIKKALTYIADRKEFIVRVAPDDLENVTQKKDIWTSISDRLNKITIEADERIEKGGCIIESNTGVTDARIPVQIGEMTEVIDSTWDSLITSGNIVVEDESGDDASQTEEGEKESDTGVVSVAPESDVSDKSEEGAPEHEEDTGSLPEQLDNSDPPVPEQDSPKNPEETK